MSIGPLSSSLGWTRGLTQIREQMVDLQRQLSTGKKAATYGLLGTDRTMSISMRARISQVNSYKSVIETTQLRSSVLVQGFERMREIVSDTRSDATVPSYEIAENGQTAMQLRAGAAFDELVSLLNTEVAGRYMYAGRATDDNPVESSKVILEGDGARAGFKQHLSERRQADLGADGLGRLVIPAAVGADVSIGEDVDGSPFGFKIAGVTNNLTGTTVAGPAGSPNTATVTFTATLPEPGDTIRVDLTMPDGTSTSVKLTALAAGEGGAAGTFEIGADENATAANFQAALATAVEASASTELSAASAFAASNDFFNIDDSNPPQRVDGPPFDSATALVDGTTSNTVFWYTGDGDSSVSARDTSVSKIDDGMYVSYGTRANEEAYTVLMRNLAVLSSDTYDTAVAEDHDRYFATMSRTVDNLSYADGEQSLESIYAQIASVQYIAGQANERHTTTKATAQDVLSDVESSDTNEVAVALLELETRLQVSYQVTSMLAQLNLTNYL
jgi:flagellar hook-associated protein 3 FlgL